MPGFLNRCDLDYSSNEKSDKCDHVNNNEYCNVKGLYYADYLSEEYRYDKNSMTNDEISDLICG